MARSRALLTDTERELISEDNIIGETDRARRYQAVSRVRSRIQDELIRDVRILRENHPELFRELIDTIETERTDD